MGTIFCCKEEEEEEENIIEIKTYQLYIEKQKHYILEISRSDKYIHFKAYEDISQIFCYYHSRYTLSSIVDLLKTYMNYTNFEEIMQFLDEGLTSSKINLDTINKETMTLLFKMYIGPKKVEVKFNLNSVMLNFEDNNESKDEDNDKNEEKGKEENKDKKENESTAPELYDPNINYTFKKQPNLKYVETFTTFSDCDYGVSDIFEIYQSYQDKKYYLAYINSNNHTIDIMDILTKKIVASLEEHKTNVISIRYFHKRPPKHYKYNYTDKNKEKEFLLTADHKRNVVVWEISDNFKKVQILQTGYDCQSCSCLLVFNVYNQDFIVTTVIGNNIYNEKGSTKVFSLETGAFIRYVYNTSSIETLKALYWINKQTKQHYICELGRNKLVINNMFFDEIYFDKIFDMYGHYYDGYIFSEKGKDFLVNCAYNGHMYLVDLYQKQIIKSILPGKIFLYSACRWNSNYIITSGGRGGNVKIIDIKHQKFIYQLSDYHKEGILTIKKFYHPTYGESLFTAGYDQKIILWTCRY